MLSQTCKISIKAVIYLSGKSKKGEKAGIKEIAKRIDASEHTIGKTLQILVKRRIINSQKGPTGGFYLDEAQQQLPIYSIVEAIDGEGIFKKCGLGLNKCSDSHPCPIHQEYKIGRDILENIFRNKKIQDLYDPVNEGIAFLMG